VLVVGDLHGNHQAARRAFVTAKRRKADVIFQVGDFGYWPHADGGAFVLACAEYAEMVGIDLYWVDGNHENHPMLNNLIAGLLKEGGHEDPIKIDNGIFYVPRGCVLEWCGRRLLGLGGAYSIDKEWRLKEDRERRKRVRDQVLAKGGQATPIEAAILGAETWSWWPGEEITEADAARAKSVGAVDVMFTHDKPISSSPRWNRKAFPECEPNQRAIQDVMAVVRPSVLMHGHLHFRYEDEVYVGNDGRTCRVYGLDAEGRNNHGARDPQQGLLPQAEDSSRMQDAMAILDLVDLSVTYVLDMP
jgi:hypothetical protein